MLGGIKAVTWSDVQQMSIIFCGLVVALVIDDRAAAAAGFVSATRCTWRARPGRLNAVTTHFDWNDRFNLWSGLIGGMFLLLSYFGCDQSQVQRYLTGKSIAQSRLSLLFNAVAKIPMQFFILFIGAMVFVFYLFVQPPLLFQRAELAAHRQPDARASTPVRRSYQRGLRRGANRRRWPWWRRAMRGDPRGRKRGRLPGYRAAHNGTSIRRAAEAPRLVERSGGEKGFSDTNYIFLSFVTRYLPAGIVGLVIAVIFAATMSASSGEINSLATVTVVDIYRRHIRREAQRPSLLDGVALGHALLGRVRGGLRRMGQAAGIADRGGECGGLAVLRIAAGMFRAGLRLPAGARHRPRSWACWPARRPSSAAFLFTGIS